MISCSTVNDWDVSKIIDKTERWLFDIENDSDEKEVSIDEFKDKEFTEEKVEVEEVFPDINDVPQIKPEFEEIDEKFFESESKEIESNEVDNENISANVKKELSLPKFILENNQDIDPILFEKSLFPDQIVFSDSGDRDSDGFKENFAAANYIFVQINSSGLTPLFLKSQLIDYIRSMDSEKYRLNLKQK